MRIQAIVMLTLLTLTHVAAQETTVKSTDMEALELTREWDKTFPQSDRVEHSKVAFHNRYGITLAADLYKPKNGREPLAAVAVSGPYGAVKEQVSGRYAQTLAEQGFLTIAFDPSYYGESGGTPRYLTSPEISTEDFSAAVDYLSTREDVDPERIGILGICGWGGFALNAAANDPRVKATVTSTMYDMSRVNANGYFDAMSADDRYKLREQLNAQRSKDYGNGSYERNGGVVDHLLGERHVLLIGEVRTVDHHRREAHVDAALAQFERISVVEVQYDLGFGPAQFLGVLHGSFGHVAQQGLVGVVARTLRYLEDDGRLGLGGSHDDSLELLHVVEVECRNGVTSFDGLGEHLARVHKTQIFVRYHSI